MPIIRIQEIGRDGDSFLTNVIFYDGNSYSCRVTSPFTAKQEKDLEWYFEEHFSFPFMDSVKAHNIGISVTEYGQKLFGQIFGNIPVEWAHLRNDLRVVRIEIVGSDEFQAIHWETLSDPNYPLPIATQSTIIRRSAKFLAHVTPIPESPTVNILLISVRINGAYDFNYRTISRPLVDALTKASIRARVDIVRPGTYQALLDYLESARSRPSAEQYHIVHFDMHGAVCTADDLVKMMIGEKNANIYPTMTKKLGQFSGERAFLFFAGENEGELDPKDADELTKRLIQYNVPVIILGACQSGREIGIGQSSLASRMLEAGAQVVIAMSYSVTVTAAQHFMTEFYRGLLSGIDLSQTIVSARREIERKKDRKAYFNQIIQLEDWMLPIIYQHKDVRLTPRPFTLEEEKRYWLQEANHYKGVSPEFGFFGRDLDILNIENLLLRRTEDNILLVQGMGGAGKTTLFKHLAAWWQRTGLVKEVFYFGYDEKAYNRQQILFIIAEKIFDEHQMKTFTYSSPDIQQLKVASELRQVRNLLIIDNIESINGNFLAIPNTLSTIEQQELQSFLHTLNAGNTLVLLGSRSAEKWLSAGTFAENIYELGGLDPESASNLAERILETRKAGKYKADNDLRRLIELLAGFPLALEVVLSNIPAKSPSTILKQLEEGSLNLNTGDVSDKTRSIIACIAYSHSNLPEDIKAVLLCLAPFTGFFNTVFSDTYIESLKAQPILANLPFDRWSDVIRESQNMGLMVQTSPGSEIYQLQPILPYFLRVILGDPTEQIRCEAINLAFREHYRIIGKLIIDKIRTEDTSTHKMGKSFAASESENLRKAALDSAAYGEDFQAPAEALSHHFDARGAHEEGLVFALALQKSLKSQEFSEKHVPLLFQLHVLSQVGVRLLYLKRYSEATEIYTEKLSLEDNYTTNPEILPHRIKTLGQLGNIYQQQGEWQEAENYFLQVLSIASEKNYREMIAGTFLNLGIISLRKRDFSKTEQHFINAWMVFFEVKDLIGQAKTLQQFGILLQEQHKWTEAKYYYNRAKIIGEYLEENIIQSQALHGLAVVSQNQGDWFAAEKYYKQSLAISVNANDNDTQAFTLYQLGSLSQDQHNWPEAENYYKQAKTIFVKSNDKISQGETLHQLGEIAQGQYNWDEAEDYYKQALATFIECKALYHQGVTQLYLGQVAQEQHEWTKAKSYYNQALTIFVNGGDFDKQKETLDHLRKLREKTEQ